MQTTETTPVPLPAECSLLVQVWKAPQVGLGKVVRWSKYVNKNEGVRVQDSLAHSHSITILCMMVVAKLHQYINLNGELLMSAFAIHDVGEGELERDVLYIDKADQKDLEEYLAFCRLYEPLGRQVFWPLQNAFLLQFARKNPECFPEDARKVMTMLASGYGYEVLAFDAIERWDYVLYAIEQYLEHGNLMILVQVLRSQVPHFDRLAGELPGFDRVIWTRELRAWANGILKAHEGQWIEQKGEV